MAIPRWKLTGNVHQQLDTVLTPRTRVRIRVRSNVPGYVDTDGDDVIVGQRIVYPGTDGSYEITGLLDHTDSGGVQYAFDIDYIEDLVGPPVGGMPAWKTQTFEWYSFEADRTLGQLIVEQYIPPEVQTALREEIQAYVEQARDISQIAVPDDVVKTLIQDPTSDTATALSASIAAALSAGAQGVVLDGGAP